MFCPSLATMLLPEADAAMNEPFKFELFLSYANTDRAWVHGYLIPALGVPRVAL